MRILKRDGDHAMNIRVLKETAQLRPQDSGSVVPRIEKAGFFHMGANRWPLIEELVPALDRAKTKYGDIGGSLILLPEEVNSARKADELGTPTRDFDETLKSRLKQVSRDYRVAFVVGLLVGQDDPDLLELGVKRDEQDPRPYNTAYLIDADLSRVICVKAKSDGTGAYKPCNVNCDLKNPIEHREVWLAVLICRDIEEE